MSLKKTKPFTNIRLFILFVTVVTAAVLVATTVDRQQHPYYAKMIRAVQQTREAQQQLGIFADSIGVLQNTQMDPLRTGLIGVEFSPITTTLGHLQAKQIAAHAGFAALYIRWFHASGLTKGQRIAIHGSGSFPSLILSAIIASEVYGLRPVIMSSAGASSFGANQPELTYWDMEQYLYKNGYIQHKTQYAAPGGQNDNGASFWPGGLQRVKQAAQRNRLSLHIPKDFDHAVQNKIDFLETYRPIALFINIGGNETGVGRYPCASRIPAGLIRERIDCRDENAGLIHYFADRNIPVINMLHIEELAGRHQISLSPQTGPSSTEHAIYYTQKSNKWLAGMALILIVGMLIYLRSK